MKKMMSFCLLLAFSSAVLADYSGGHAVGRMYVNQSGTVAFGTINQAKNTCNYYSLQFSFDSSKEGGKGMLSLLLAAKMSKAKIDIWYTPSSSPGTTHTNGCNNSTLAVATHIGLQ